MTLPCTVEHLGKLVVVWKHGEEVVTAGAMMVSPDPRYSLGGGYSLRVENLRGRDEGAYTCSVSTLSGPVTVTHHLEILGENKIAIITPIFLPNPKQSIDLQL